MSTLWVANCNPRQYFELLCRLPERSQNAPPFRRMIRPMTIERIDDLTDLEVLAIEDQLTRFGAVDAGDRLTGGNKIERLFSRSAIKPERVRQALGFNVNLQDAEGKERLQNLGAAMSRRAEEALIDNNVQGNFNTIEVSTQENSDDPKLALGARVSSSPDDRARTANRQRNRSRKA